jgi:hypothetical protein
MSREAAAELMAGWQRAVRAALGWARDPGDIPKAKKPARKGGGSIGKKGTSKKAVSSKGTAKKAVSAKTKAKGKSKPKTRR